MGAHSAVTATWSQEQDGIGAALARFAAALPPREDARVLAALLEEELREGLGAVEALQSHLEGLLDALGAGGRPSALRLLTAAEDGGVREQAEQLADLLPQLRKRVAKAVALLHRG
jgi:hypothetical protein